MGPIRSNVLLFGVLTGVASGACSDVAPSPAVNVAGAYSLTITAAATCQQLLVTQVGTGSSTPIDLTQNGSAITGTLDAFNPPTLMSAGVSGQIVSGNILSLTLGFHWSNSHVGSRDVAGSGVGAANSAGITGTFSGTITEFAPFSSVAITCNAPDHQFVLSRLGA